MRLLSTHLDPDGRVAKFVFSDAKAITEVVGYRFNDRGVVCFSTMSGCPIGCLFCGTGKKFIRNLKKQEMIDQITVALDWVGQKGEIQIMAMSMGEPMLNMVEVKFVAEHYLKSGVDFFISTVGIEKSDSIDTILELALYKRFGMQISLHLHDQADRIALLGSYPNLMTIERLKVLANAFAEISHRPVYWNYICKGSETDEDAAAVAKIIGNKHHLTCSVLCNTGAFVKGDPTPALNFGLMCSKHGVSNWSVFNPAGQDAIGGGCGQLLYVQEFLKTTSALQ